MQGKRFIVVLGSAVVWLSGVGLQAQAQGRWRSLADHLFAPRLINAAYDELNLTEQQVALIRKEVEEAQKEFARLEGRLQAEVAALGELLAAERPDEQAALEQLDKVLAVEHEIKRRQLTLLVRIKRALTPEQHARLRQVRARRAARAKWQRIQQMARRWELERRDVSIFRRLEKELQPLWDSGKYIEAEAAIDRALEQLKSKANE